MEKSIEEILAEIEIFAPTFAEIENEEKDGLDFSFFASLSSIPFFGRLDKNNT